MCDSCVRCPKNQPFVRMPRVFGPVRLRKSCAASLSLRNALRRRGTDQIFGRWPVVAMIDWIDATHRFLADLFFDDMRDQAGRARDHENAVECRRVHPQIGEDRADGAVHIDRERFFCGGERFLDCSRCSHVHAVHAASAAPLPYA